MSRKKPKSRTRVMMIVNPKSGKSRPYFSAGKVADMFAENQMEVAVYFTAPEYKADYLIREHIDEFDILACCGGDGTISEAISGMMACEENKPMGYIPAGTTNDLARSLGISTNMTRAARSIIFDDPHPLDVGSFDEEYFIYIASFGAFTEVSYETPQAAKNLFGHFAYLLHAVQCMHKIRSYHLKVKTDERRVEGDFIFGAVTNSTSVAGIFQYPEKYVDFADGKYEILLIKKPKNIWTALSILITMLRKSYRHDNIIRFKASDIRVISEEPLDWSVDGEHKTGGLEVHIQNNPRAVSLIMNS